MTERKEANTARAAVVSMCIENDTVSLAAALAGPAMVLAVNPRQIATVNKRISFTRFMLSLLTRLKRNLEPVFSSPQNLYPNDFSPQTSNKKKISSVKTSLSLAGDPCGLPVKDAKKTRKLHFLWSHLL